MSSGISEGICRLAELGRISAASAIVLSRTWPDDCRRFSDTGSDTGLGLHFTLTQWNSITSMPSLSAGGALPSIQDFVIRTLRGQTNLNEVEAELHAQLDAFEQSAVPLPLILMGTIMSTSILGFVGS